jgi:hypothetical protein
LINGSELYSAREKNGIYIPHDRYFEEEAEKKVCSLGPFSILTSFHLSSENEVNSMILQLLEALWKRK